MPSTLFCCINCNQNVSDKEFILSMITKNLNVITVHSKITEMQIKGRVLISKMFYGSSTTGHHVTTDIYFSVYRDDQISIPYSSA